MTMADVYSEYVRIMKGAEVQCGFSEIDSPAMSEGNINAVCSTTANLLTLLTGISYNRASLLQTYEPFASRTVVGLGYPYRLGSEETFESHIGPSSTLSSFGKYQATLHHPGSS